MKIIFFKAKLIKKIKAILVKMLKIEDYAIIPLYMNLNLYLKVLSHLVSENPLDKKIF